MWNARQRLLTIAGGTVLATTVVGGVAFAQSPDSGTPTPPPDSAAPAQTPATPTPGQRDDGDCPDKGGSTGARQAPPSTTPNF